LGTLLQTEAKECNELNISPLCRLNVIFW